MSRVVLPFNNRPFSYPGRLARFDPSHFAAKNICFTAVPSKNRVINLLDASVSNSVIGTPIATFDGTIGPSVNIDTTTGTTSCIIVGGPTSTVGQGTIAAIVRTGSDITNHQGIFGEGGGWDVAGMVVYQGTLVFRGGGGGFTQANNVVMAANTNYFLVVSANHATACNFLALNLNTGQIQTQTVTQNLTVPGSVGTYYFGNWTSNSTAFIGQIASVMYSKAFLTAPQLLQFAKDPWSFWYPRSLDMATMLTRASVAAAFMARQNIINQAVKRGAYI